MRTHGKVCGFFLSYFFGGQGRDIFLFWPKTYDHKEMRTVKMSSGFYILDVYAVRWQVFYGWLLGVFDATSFFLSICMTVVWKCLYMHARV